MSSRRLTLPLIIIALLYILGSFVGLENETCDDVHPDPMSFASLRGLSEISNDGDKRRVTTHTPERLSNGVSKLDNRSHAQDCPPLWRSYVESYQRYTNGSSKQFSTDGMDFPQTTSSKFTRITIFNEQSSYHLCDLLLVRIQARDWNDQPKTYGGDFFRMKIYNGKPYSAASEDEIIDYQNGTYLALFTLRWTGEVEVQVKLVHPVELLPLLKMALSGELGLNMTFIGEFVSGNITEQVKCRYVELPAPMCSNFSNPRTHGPWFCQQPRNTRLSCKDWMFHKKYIGSFLEPVKKHITPLSNMLFRKSHMVEVKNNCSLIVQPKYISSEDQSSLSPVLPHCRMHGLPTGIHASGYFFEGDWYQDNCTVAKYDPASGMECLRNRKIVLLGDSTARQIYDSFKDQYKKYLKPVPLQQGVWPRYGPIVMQSTEYNASVHFHFHGPPSHGVGLSARRDFIEFIADRLDSGRDGCPTVYLVSVWAHFLVSGRDFYTQRMSAIQRATTDYLERCPWGKVIIKGGNTREHSTVFNPVHSTEWIVVELELALREIFREEKRVGFIDAIDITRAQPYPDSTHPNLNIVKEYVNRILTYICKD